MAKKYHRTQLVRKRGKKIGASPGVLVHVGETGPEKTGLHLIRYDAGNFRNQALDSAVDCRPQDGSSEISWFNINGVDQASIVQTIGDNFNLHRLVMEDIVNTDHRPKLEHHDDYLFIITKMLQFDESRTGIRSEQVSLIIGHNYVLTFQERPGDVFDGVRNRLQSGRSIRRMGTDYLAYAVIDAIVDNYFVLLEQIGEQVELLEDELLNRPGPDTLARIHHFKREMLLLRKAVWPLREVINSLIRDDSELIKPDTHLFLRDVYDHSIHIMDTIDTLRDLLSGMLDLYISSVSNRTNEIVKVLTIFASIFMPLTFIAGVYGMNFEFMPELERAWAYPAVLLFMAAVAAGLILFFRHRKWL